MPILNGQRVSLAEWRAAQAAPAVSIADDAVEPAAVEEKPRRRSKGDIAAQVTAALGIAAPVADDANDEQPVAAASSESENSTDEAASASAVEEPASPAVEQAEPEEQL